MSFNTFFNVFSTYKFVLIKKKHKLSEKFKKFVSTRITCLPSFARTVG